MSVVSKLRRGSLWIAAARLSANVLNFLGVVVLARLLMPQDFGLVALGTTLLLIVTSVSNLSLPQAIIQLEEPTDDHLATAWTLGAIRGLLMSAIIALSAPFIADFYGDQRLVLIVYAIAIVPLFEALMSPRIALLTRDLIFHQQFLFEVGEKFVYLVVSGLVAYYTRSYLALVCGIVAGELAKSLISHVVAPYRPRLRLREWRSLLGFSVWLTLSQIVDTINYRLDPLIVGKFLSVRQLGLVTVSIRLSTLPRETISPLIQMLFPALRKAQGDPARLRAAVMRAQAVTTALALPSAVLIMMLAKPLVLLFLGQKWLAAVPIVQAIAMGPGIISVGMVAQPLAMAMGQTRLWFRRSTQMMMIRLPVIAGSLYADGLRGYLVSRIVLAVINMILNLDVVKRLSGLPRRRLLLRNWRTFAACLAMVGVGLLLPDIADDAKLPTVIAFCAIGAAALGATYLATKFALWLATGKPAGVEEEILETLVRVRGVLRRRGGGQARGAD